MPEMVAVADRILVMGGFRMLGEVVNDRNYGVLVAPENPSSPHPRPCAVPSVKIVSLTVTEKGYCHDPATGELNESHPDIIHDLGEPGPPTFRTRLPRRRTAGRERRARVWRPSPYCAATISPPMAAPSPRWSRGSQACRSA
jgi:hypothetical protein